MHTPVWPLVAKVRESHDKLMQSTWGGGSRGNGGPWRSCPLPCVCSPEVLMEKWGWRRLPSISFLPSHGAQEPPRGAQPQGLGVASALPHLTHLFLSYQCSPIQEKPGSWEPSSNLA